MASRKYPIGTPSPVPGLTSNFSTLNMVDNPGLSNGFWLGVEDSQGPPDYPSSEASILIPTTNIVGPDPRSGPTILGAINADLSLATKQAIFTVPAGRVAIITAVAYGRSNASLATAEVSLGFNAAAADVVANAAHTGITGATTTKLLTLIAAAYAVGQAAAVFGIIANVQQAATVQVTAIGFLV